MPRFRLVSNLLVWLLIAAVPLQGLAAVPCSCAAQAPPTVTDEASGQATACCCRQAEVDDVLAESCCHRANSGDRCSGCCCGPSCQCNQDDSPLQPVQSAPENRSRATELALPSSALCSPQAVDPEPRLPGRPKADLTLRCGSLRLVLPLSAVILSFAAEMLRASIGMRSCATNHVAAVWRTTHICAAAGHDAGNDRQQDTPIRLSLS